MIDIDQIKKDVELILIHSQDYPFDLDSTELINKWVDAKKPFIEKFGGKTIVRSEKPVKVLLSERQRRERFNDFVSILKNNEILTEDFENFLRSNEEGFFDNKVLLPLPSLGITLGSKISKSFKKFIKNRETIRWAQDTASRFIQENKIEGYLYLSVDPRDFLTLSENNENWWSCQTLDGDFRTGCLSYMVDNTTVIAYLANKEQEYLKCLPSSMEWNSKKWRMLLHTDLDHIVYYNRQYPYESENLLHEIHFMVLDTMNFDNFSNIFNYGFRIIKRGERNYQEMLEFNQITAGGRIYDTRDVIDVSEYRGYCDLISSNVYSPIASIKASNLRGYKDGFLSYREKEEEDKDFINIFKIKIGGLVPCPCCGHEHLEREDSFLCNDCIADKDADEDFYLRCNSCGHKIYEDDEVFWENGFPHCKDCYTFIKQEEEEENLEGE